MRQEVYEERASMSPQDDSWLQLRDRRCRDENGELVPPPASPSAIWSVMRAVGQGSTEGKGFESKISSPRFLIPPRESI